MRYMQSMHKQKHRTTQHPWGHYSPLRPLPVPAHPTINFVSQSATCLVFSCRIRFAKSLCSFAPTLTSASTAGKSCTCFSNEAYSSDRRLYLTLHITSFSDYNRISVKSFATLCFSSMHRLSEAVAVFTCSSIRFIAFSPFSFFLQEEFTC